MELSKLNEETKIWYNINDARNLEIITRETQNTLEFVPKVAVQRNVEIVNEMIPESTIQDILVLKYDTLNVFEIMTHQVSIISYLSAKFRSTDAMEITWTFYRPYLQWILETSEHITVKFGVPVDDIKNTGTVTRSSYKFCDLKEGCVDTYPTNPLGSSGKGRPPRCMGDHYVHNKIVRDLRSLISVIDIESNEQGPMSHYLRLGLTTTDFVIRHMYQELGIFNTYLKNEKNFNIENYYICHRCKRGGNNGPVNNFNKQRNTGHHSNQSQQSGHSSGRGAPPMHNANTNSNKSKSNKNTFTVLCDMSDSDDGIPKVIDMATDTKISETVKSSKKKDRRNKTGKRDTNLVKY